MPKEKRIGLIVPSANTTVERDFHKLAPSNVSIHSMRMWATEATPESLRKMNEEVEHCARYLASARVDVLVYACTSGTFTGGVGYDLRVLDKIFDATHIPAVATSLAAVEALNRLKTKKVSVATPYSDEIGGSLSHFLEARGFEVVSIKNLNLRTTLERGDQTEDIVYEFARMTDTSEADGLFLSCTNWGGALEAVERLEQTLQKPVVSSNQATIWAALRAIGHQQPIMGFGRLFRNLRN